MDLARKLPLSFQGGRFLTGKGHSISFDLPSNFLRIAIWVVCGNEWMSKWKGFKVRTTNWTYTHVLCRTECSFVIFMPKSFSMESGGRIQISFLLFDWEIIELTNEGFHPACRGFWSSSGMQ